MIITDAPQIGRGTNPWAGLLTQPIAALSMEGIDTAVKERQRPKSQLKSAACARDLQKVAAGIQDLAQPQYDRASVTEVAKAVGSLPVTESGKGPEYGSIVHKCLEWMAGGREPARHDVEQLGAEFELDPVPADEILAELQRVRGSDLWRRAMAAPERHTEVPFSLVLDGSEVGRQPGGVFVSGVIDLAFREGDRWSLIDYKTDRIAGDAEAHVAIYAEQLRLYKKAWHRLTGHAPAELFLLFTDTCTAHPICDNPRPRIEVRLEVPQ